ncbi:MAG: hemolysin III family protein [Isosphaeraceae bacterium]|nr:hemolysin III family protein [Isosphaeraceae bacterium]
MDFFDLREPVSCWTHGAWLILSLPGAYMLWQQGRGDRLKQLSLLIFGLSLAFCFAASATYHGFQGPSHAVELFDRVDHIGIYVLIAGTYTPVAWIMLRGRMREIVLTMAWGIAVLGAVEIWFCGVLSPTVSTCIYLAMGWGALFCYFEIARLLSHRAVRLMLIGGVFYSVGALFHILGWPVLWPGVFQAHELFHVFVMAGSLAHFWFMLRVVAPYGDRCPLRPSVGAADQAPALARFGKWRYAEIRERA